MSYMKKCENCSSEHNGEYGSGRFCSVKCARGFSTKAKRSLINKKVSKALIGRGNGDVIKNCKNCNIEFTVPYNKRHIETCSISCNMKLRWTDDAYRNARVEKIRRRCSVKKERDRLRDIGRKGGFGIKGYTENGTYYESKFEKQCFEYLENSNIKFEAHKILPSTSKVSDIYLIDLDLYIELDGINRELRKKWLGKNYDKWLEKLKLYDSLNLKYKIFYNLEEFIDFIENI